MTADDPAVADGLLLEATLTCPHCGRRVREGMPRNACIVVYDCPGCAARLRPKPGDCCVFCSYADVPCPPVQEAGRNCCGGDYTNGL